VVDLAAAGVEISPIVDMSGEHHFNQVVFDDVRVPAHHLVGARDEGWRRLPSSWRCPVQRDRGSGPQQFLGHRQAMHVLRARP
jgi:hypothetical protein